MRAGAYKRNDFERNITTIYKQPIRSYMTLPATLIVADQGMISILSRQRLFISEFKDNII